MGKTKRGVPDGSGPHKDSYQRRQHGGTGKRKQKGLKCPKQK